MVILQNAWRNIWRQKRRTLLTVSAISVTTALLIFSISIEIGSYKMMIENTLRLGQGYGQIVHKEYKETPSIRYTIQQASQLVQRLKKQFPQFDISAKAMAFGILSSEQRSIGIQITGVEPKFEQQHSAIAKKIIQGHYLSPNSSNEIVMGKTLANNLKVKAGEQITFLGTDKQGSLAVDSFTIVGLYQTGMKEMDRSLTFINLPYFQQLFALPDQVHKVIISADSFSQVTEQIPAIEKMIQSQKDLIAIDWRKIAPGVYKAIELDLSSAVPIYLSLIIVVGFGFMNTMYMSVYERTREFGMLMAIGMHPGMIARLFFTETLLILMLGFVGGIGLGATISEYFVINGLYFEGTEVIYEQFGLPPTIYPLLNAWTLLPAPLIFTLFTLLATIFPIIKINKMSIVESMRAVK